MTDSLQKIFDKKRQELVKEDFEIGQAAQALFELQKSAKALVEFLNGPFSEGFKQMHNDPRNRDMAHELVKTLEAKQAELTSVVEEVTGYLYDAENGLNPADKDNDKRRNGRWSRWEHRTPRHVQKQQDMEDGI